MVDIYTIKLTEDAFERVVTGKKTVQLEINDKHHKVLAVGNQLTFVCETEEQKQEQKAVIENLLYFGDIKEAIERIGKFLKEIKKLIENKQPVHPDALSAYNDLLNKR